MVWPSLAAELLLLHQSKNDMHMKKWRGERIRKSLPDNAHACI